MLALGICKSQRQNPNRGERLELLGKNLENEIAEVKFKDTVQVGPSNAPDCLSVPVCETLDKMAV
jgi:hypothetical protein